jgi:hypothetical protein
MLENRNFQLAPNVELTGAARLLCAASVLSAGLEQIYNSASTEKLSSANAC